MRRLLLAGTMAGVLVAAAVGPAAARQAPTYDVSVTLSGCAFTIDTSWTRVRVEQVQAWIIQDGAPNGIGFGPEAHGQGAFKNYGNNVTLSWSAVASSVTHQWQFGVTFYDSSFNPINTVVTDPIVALCE